MNILNKLAECKQWIIRIVRRRYYFITYQGVRRDNDPSVNVWHDVTNLTPMQYRQKLLDCENNTEGKSYYRDFIILNTERISRGQFMKWKDNF